MRRKRAKLLIACGGLALAIALVAIPSAGAKPGPRVSVTGEIFFVGGPLRPGGNRPFGPEAGRVSVARHGHVIRRQKLGKGHWHFDFELVPGRYVFKANSDAGCPARTVTIRAPRNVRLICDVP